MTSPGPLDPPVSPMPDFGFGPRPDGGRLDLLEPGLRRLTAQNPGLMTGPGTNTYLIGPAEGSDDLVVVDPGPDDAVHRRAILAAAASLGVIRWVLVTHTHPDHAPGAAALARASGARVVGFARAARFSPDLCVGDGWALSLGDERDPLTLVAVHTPGHASDHLCWFVVQRATLLTGDHIMEGSTVVIRPPDGDLDQYLSSLQALRDRPHGLRQLAPGHGRLMAPAGAVVDALVAHRLWRHERVRGALREQQSATIDDLLAVVYADVTEAQLPVARFSLRAHLRSLGAAGEAAAVAADSGDELEVGADTIDSRWLWRAR